MPYWRLSNVGGGHVYRVAEGRHADLAFRNLPVGTPMLMGSVVAMGTREEALALTVRQLTLCQAREELSLPEAVATWPRFVFEEVEIPIEPSNILEMAERLGCEGYGPEQVIGRSTYLRHAIAEDEPLKLVHGRRRTRHVLVRYLAAFTSKTAPPCVRFVGVGALEIFQAADEELLRSWSWPARSRWPWGGCSSSLPTAHGPTSCRPHPG